MSFKNAESNMSAPDTDSTDSATSSSPASNGRAERIADREQRLKRFTLWALHVLGYRVETGEGEVYRLYVPEDRLEQFNGAGLIRFRFGPTREGQLLDSAVQQVQADSPMFCWLTGLLQEQGMVMHASAAHQPINPEPVNHKITQSYRLDTGMVELVVGCFEDRPLVRLTYTQRDSSGHPEIAHYFYDRDSRPISQDLRRQLRLDELRSFDGNPFALEQSGLEEWLQQADQHFLQQQGDSAEHPQLIAATVVWCKYIEGHVQFQIGPRNAQVAFGDWAELLASGAVQPPPFVCPTSGKSSYHLAAADDGRITVFEALEVCSETGRRVLEGDLVVCSLTGNRVVPDVLKKCPVTGEALLRRCLARCSMCCQSVSPHCLQGNRCSACRNLAKLDKAEPRMACVLGRHPGLDRWRRWRISETDEHYILMANDLFRQLLVALDRETLDVCYLATSGRLLARWSEVPETQYRDYL